MFYRHASPSLGRTFPLLNTRDFLNPIAAMAVLSTQLSSLLMPAEIRRLVHKLSSTPQDGEDAVFSESPGKTITICWNSW